MIEDFIILSEILTGEDKLDFVLARQYFERLQKTETTANDFQAVMEHFHQIRATSATPEEVIKAVGEQIVAGGEAFKKAAGQIIYLWYTGAVKDAATTKYGSADQYFSGLFWKIVRGGERLR
jgi:hypothetical protein